MPRLSRTEEKTLNTDAAGRAGATAIVTCDVHAKTLKICTPRTCSIPPTASSNSTSATAAYTSKSASTSGSWSCGIVSHCPGSCLPSAALWATPCLSRKSQHRRGKSKDQREIRHDGFRNCWLIVLVVTDVLGGVVLIFLMLLS